MLEEPPLNPQKNRLSPPKNGLPKEWVEGTENPELAYLLNLQKILYLQTILSLQKITTSRGRGGRFALRVGPTLSHPEANRGDVRSVMKTSHRNP